MEQMSLSETESEPNIGQTILARVARIRQSLSPWVQRSLAINALNETGTPEAVDGLRPMALTTVHSIALSERVQRAGTATQVWQPDALSLDPNVMDRFAAEIVGRFPLQAVGLKYEGRLEAGEGGQDVTGLPLVGGEPATESPVQARRRSQPSEAPGTSTPTQSTQPQSTPRAPTPQQAPSPPHFMAQQRRRPSWLPERKAKSAPAKPSIDLALQKQVTPDQPQKVQPKPENLRLFSQVEYLSDMGKSPQVQDLFVPPPPTEPPQRTSSEAPSPKAASAQTGPSETLSEPKKIARPKTRPIAPTQSVTPPQISRKSEAAEPLPQSPPDTVAEPTPQPSETGEAISPTESELNLATHADLTNKVDLSAPPTLVAAETPEQAAFLTPSTTEIPKQVSLPPPSPPTKSLERGQSKIQPMTEPQPKEKSSTPPLQAATISPKVSTLGASKIEVKADTPPVPIQPKTPQGIEQQPITPPPPGAKEEAGRSDATILEDSPSPRVVKSVPPPLSSTRQPDQAKAQLNQAVGPAQVERRQVSESSASSSPVEPKIQPSAKSGEGVDLGPTILRRSVARSQMPLSQPQSPAKPKQPIITPKQARVQLRAKGWRFKQKPTDDPPVEPQQVQRAVESLAQAPGPGRALPDESRHIAEEVLGQDFSDVRVHTAQLKPLNVEAATQGRTVVVEAGQERFDSPQSVATLGHELSHVVQRHPKPGGTMLQTQAAADTPVLPLVSNQLSENDPTIRAEEQAASGVEQQMTKRLQQPLQRQALARQGYSSNLQSRITSQSQVSDPITQEIATWLGQEEIIQRAPLVSPPRQLVSRQAETEAGAAEVSDTVEENEETSGTEEQQPDLDQLARQVYPLIKRMLKIERERRAGGMSLLNGGRS